MNDQPILVGVDFSDCGRAALDAAAQLAQDLDVELVLVHAFDPMRTAPALMGAAGSELMHESHAERAQEEAIALTRDWAERARAAGATVRTIAEDGDPQDLLLASIAAEGAGMLVVGTHGHKGFKRFVLGSVAESLVRACPIPVLVVPHHDKKDKKAKKAGKA